MAITNHERVGKAMELLKSGLRSFVERELKSQHAQIWFQQAREAVGPSQQSLFKDEANPPWDAASLLNVLWNQWQLVFRKTLGNAERSLVSELRDIRNRWAHQGAFSGDDAYRALDSAGRLLTAVSAGDEAAEVDRMKKELLRVQYDEQVRTDKRKSAAAVVETTGNAGLKAWRDVVTPHKDVASGKYQQAEFAADLWQVHEGEGGEEYQNPSEFFRRTFLTQSLKALLVGAARRVTGNGGDPVVQLQTNFGGGKTHSMLALYHLFSGAKPGTLAGAESVLQEAGVEALPKVKRVVLVGTQLSAGRPVKKADGAVVRTIWGELAWQLGGKRAFARIASDDEHATSPGGALRELLNEHGPCIVLIDEWVAYARQLHETSDLPAGTFDTQFTFAQTLTEAVKTAKNCLLVISLPASDTTASPHTLADDVEVGGTRGREALDRLRNVIGRLESSWRPASAEEGFEIVRRRLFEPMSDEAQFRDRDHVVNTFADLYRSQKSEFPADSYQADYVDRMKRAYPIHPELFDRLYGEWSTLVKFQRTRGVLRLMAGVIHTLWERGDRSPLIQPGNVPIDDQRVSTELTRYLSDNWVPIIEKDVDGPSSLPLQLDGTNANLGKLHACRRVARTIYMGSAPSTAQPNHGVEDRRIKLGCVVPGESPAVFGDALRRLAATATYLNEDGARYWYATQPTVNRLAEERAAEKLRHGDEVAAELERRIREEARRTGDFARVHALPGSGADVPDDPDARLVVLGPDQAYSRDSGNAAELSARSILETRGSSPRIFRNALIFLAPDKARVSELDQAIAKFVAWESIIAEKGEGGLNLTPQQVKKAEGQRASADGVVASRLAETYQWLLVPVQRGPSEGIEWQAVRLAAGQEPLSARASKKLRADDSLITTYHATNLRRELDRVLWRGDHVAIRQLTDDFARYLYLPRMAESGVLLKAIRDGLGSLTWEAETFAYAEGYDEARERYLGLRCGQHVSVTDDDSGLLVKPDSARRQLAADAEAAGVSLTSGGSGVPGGDRPGSYSGDSATPGPEFPRDAKPRLYHGSVSLNPQRVGRDAGRIADEVISHLAGLVGSDVRVRLEIEAEIPDGAPEQVVRVVTENGRTLKFSDGSGFEAE